MREVLLWEVKLARTKYIEKMSIAEKPNQRAGDGEGEGGEGNDMSDLVRNLQRFAFVSHVCVHTYAFMEEEHGT